MMTKIFLVLVIVFGFIYWRGAKSVLAAKGYDCNYKIVYAICMTNSTKVMNAPSPQFMEIMKAGINFKK